MVVGWTIRARAQSRRRVVALPAMIGFGLSLAQSDRARNIGGRSSAENLGTLLAWGGVLAAISVLTVGVWWLLPSWLAVSFALRLH